MWMTLQCLLGSVLNGAVCGGMVDVIMGTLLHHAESAPLAKAGLDLLWSAHDSSQYNSHMIVTW